MDPAMDIDDPTPAPAPPPASSTISWTGGGVNVGVGQQPGESTSKKKKTSKVVVDMPAMDLDTYISSYVGHTRVDRLLFIADRCPSLTVEAYKMALADLRQTQSTWRYQQVLQRLNEFLASRGQQPLPMDQAWFEATARACRAQAERLDSELKAYKNNLIKESIRMGHNDLGDHYYNCGDLANALKCYSRTRDYCTTAKHIVDMCLNVIKVSFELGNYSHVQSYVVKAESTPDIPDKNIVQAKLGCATGLVNLESGKFKRAALSFLDIAFELGNQYNDVISANDIAVYGGLCALASFDRSELKTKVFDNAEFKQYLELEPEIRDLLNAFYNSKYAQCLQLLDKLKNNFLLDLYLHSHVDLIYQNIRKKALVQYFSPFLSIDMNQMATAFDTTISQLEPEIASLITENQIRGRIDSHNKVLRVKQTDQRSSIFEKALKNGAEYQKQTAHMLLRMKLMRNDMIVKDDRQREDRDHQRDR
ncbi:cop9 signalosome complex subunit [Borealophlyctis nickersoniae]|nr:cop9 signalosome complex subunit [Borealophlyctis nickersoniae]